MKRLRNALSLTLALALALSLSVVSASAVELTSDNALSFIDVQINIDVDNEVSAAEEEIGDYYNPYWGKTYSNTGYYVFERDTSITVTYLPGVDYTGNEYGEPFIWIALFPYRQQADGSYVALLEEDEFGNPMPYVLYPDGTFQPKDHGSILPGNYSSQNDPNNPAWVFLGLDPGESVTFTIPFDQFGDDLLYEMQAVLGYNWGEDPISGLSTSSSSWRYYRIVLDEERVAQLRAEQSGAASPTVAGFSDVHGSDYFADAVAWAVNAGITTGTSATTFSPEATVTRAQAVTFLWRAAGSPEPAATSSPFADVADQSAYYYKAVLWAAEQGITNGVSATTFGTNNAVAYDQILAFLARAADAETGSGDWSQAAIDWAAENGLTDGLTFSAKDACPRSDVVYCLWQQMA